MRKTYQYVILLILVLTASWYALSHKELFMHLKTISIFNIIGLSLVVFMTHVLLGCQFKCLLKMFGIGMNFGEWFGLSVCNSMFNYYLPAKGGLAIRAYYLKKKHAFTYSHYTSLTVGSQIISFFLSAAAGLVFALLFKPIHGKWHVKFVVLFAALLLMTVIGTAVLLFLLKLGKTFKNSRFNNILTLFSEGLGLFGRRKRLVVVFSLLHILRLFSVGARLFICFSAIGVDVEPLQMLIIPSLTTFSLMLPLTPANLGIREGIISGCAYWFGLPADQALLAALVDRAAAIIITFTLGLVFSRILLSDVKFSKAKV